MKAQSTAEPQGEASEPERVRRTDHSSVYSHYLRSKYDYDIGIRSGWMMQGDEVAPYMNFAWQVEVSPIVHLGVRSLLMLERSWTGNPLERGSSAFGGGSERELYNLRSEDVDVVSYGADLSLMPWMKFFLGPRANYTVGVVMTDLTTNSVHADFRHRLRSALLNLISVDVWDAQVYFGGLYDFEKNSVFGSIGVSYLSKNFNEQETYDPNAHFLTNSDVRFGVNPGLVLRYYYDQEASTWQQKSTMDLKLYLSIENNALSISPGVRIYSSSDTSNPLSLDFFLELRFLRY